VSGSQLAVRVGPDDHSRGPDDATITLVEYGDYQCPYCGQAYPIVEELLRTLGSHLRLVFRNLPLVDVHAHAQAAAELAEAAGMQGKFWEMHDELFENQDDLSDKALARYATTLGLDTDRVARDLAAGDPRARVEADFEGAIRSGANGTPTFFVNGARYDGSWQFEPFERHLRSLLEH
jgi:protein-disulfide isomerase